VLGNSSIGFRQADSCLECRKTAKPMDNSACCQSSGLLVWLFLFSPANSHTKFSMFKFKKKRGNLRDDCLSGFTVSLVLVPEAIAFSFIAGVSPIIGLWSAVFVGFITAAFGGRPGMICGATGAIAIVAAQAFHLGAATGIEGMDYKYLFIALILAGIIQTTIGLCKMGRLIRLVPHPVMMGFVNGLAVVIAMGQLEFFKNAHSQ